jgi:ribosome-binding factor A
MAAHTFGVRPEDMDKVRAGVMSLPDGFEGKGGGVVVPENIEGGLDTTQLHPSELAGRQESDGERKSMFAQSDEEPGDDVISLRASLGFDKPRGLRNPPKVEGSSKKNQAAVLQLEQEKHEKELQRLRGDPEALAKYVMEQGDKLTAAEEANLDASEKDPSTRKSLVPEGFKDWGEVVAEYSGNAKRAKKSAAVLKAEQSLVLKQAIKAPKTSREPSRRQIRVAANIQRVLESVFTRRLVRDATLYPANLPIEIVDVSVTSDLRRAYVRWMLPFPTATHASPDARRDVDELEAMGLKPKSASSSAFMASIARRIATDRGLARINASKDAETQAALRLRPLPKKTPAQMTREHYGDATVVSHLSPSVRSVVATVSEALERNRGNLKRSVGFELGMQYMPVLEFHRYVAAETDGFLEARFASPAARRTLEEV